MSLYRQTTSRQRRLVPYAAVAVVALVVGLVVGRATKNEPSLASQVTHVRDRAEEAIAGMELARTHYSTQHAAGQAQAERARKAFERIADDLAAIRPAETRRARAAVDAAVAATERNEPEAVVAAATRHAQAALEAAAGR